MRIVRVRYTIVRVPRATRFLPKTAHGEVKFSEYVILQMESNDGAIGLGEVTCSPKWNGEGAADTCSLLDRLVPERIIGSDPSDWKRIDLELASELRGRPFLRSAFEMACLDLIGKAAGVPVAFLLGGVAGSPIATKIVLPARSPNEVATMALHALELGASVLKVKVGIDLDEDATRVRAVRDAVGEEVPLIVDANEGWRPDNVEAAIDIMAASAVRAVEQPLPRSASKIMRRLRKKGLPLVGDESIWSWADIVAAAHDETFDVVSIYPGKSGGIRHAVSMAETAHALGLDITFGSNLELGIGAAAMAHAISASPPTSTTVPSDLIGPLYFESALVTNDSFVTWSGASVPTGPGLGVELDKDALDQYSVPR